VTNENLVRDFNTIDSDMLPIVALVYFKTSCGVGPSKEISK